MTRNVISFSDVSKAFGSEVANHDVSFEAHPGRVTGFVGRNGAGKTTALRILLGLCQPDSGDASLSGRPIADFGGMIGMSLGPSAHPAMRVEDHMLIRATRLGVDHESVDEMLDQTSLGGAKRKRISSLSLGQKQRLSLACALIGAPDVVILDEPMNGLDPAGLMWLRGHLRKLASAGSTVLVSSHLLAEMDRLVDYVVLLDRTVLWAGSRQEMNSSGFEDIEDLFRSEATREASN